MREQESFYAKLPDALPNGEPFYSLAEARIVIESWRRRCDTLRPHPSLGYKPPTPAELLWPETPTTSTRAAKQTMNWI